MITAGSKIGIVCCSNGQSRENADRIRRLEAVLKSIGLQPVFSDHIYVTGEGFSATRQERAEALMNFYRDDEIKGIFDISGGDLANGILPDLDYDVIADSDKTFWGYSDLTTVINAIYARTGKASVLYQIRNLLYDCAEQQIADFTNSVINGGDDLFRIERCSLPAAVQTGREETDKDRADGSNKVIRQKLTDGEDKDMKLPEAMADGNSGEMQRNAADGNHSRLHGIVVGGNIRCFLKLAGTEYMPDLRDKILLLEGYSGTSSRMETYLCQLEQLGAFRKVAGILLGTFTEMQEKKSEPSIETLVRKFAGEDMPIAVTRQIGHGTDAKGIWIGREEARCLCAKAAQKRRGQ